MQGVFGRFVDIHLPTKVLVEVDGETSQNISLVPKMEVYSPSYKLMCKGKPTTPNRPYKVQYLQLFRYLKFSVKTPHDLCLVFFLGG